MAPPREKPHRHRFKFSAWFGLKGREVMLRCPCGEEVRRTATPEEREAHDIEFGFDAYGTIHAFWRKFAPDGRWAATGYDLMQRIEAWAKRRADVRLVGVDDSQFTTSLLVLIESQSTRPGQEYYMGTTVVYVPQHGGEPAEFFLYSHHRESLIMALVDIRRSAKPIERARALVKRRVRALLSGRAKKAGDKRG